MDVRLPKLGEGAESGVVVSLLVKVGDAVTSGQTILELENEKAVAPIPSPAAGTVTAIHVKEGDKITVGAALLSLDAAGPGTPATAAPAPGAPARKTAPAAPTPAPTAAPASAPAAAPVPPAQSDAPVAAAPAIRRLARELGLDLTRVRGTGRGGRIEMEDLRAYLELLQRLAFEPKPAAALAPGATPTPAPEPVDFSKWGPVTRKPLSTLRRTIAQRLAQSWLATPRVTQFDEADITALNELRKRFAPAYERRGTRLTLTAFVLHALARTLKQHPVFNTSLDESAGELVLKDYVHLGLAVDTEAGLIVPVIRDADRKDLVQLSQDVETLAAKARDRKVSLEDLKGGTFTLSNQGGIGSGHFTPIVNTPEVAILGLGRGALKPAIREGRVEPRLLLPVALSYDHRVIDGGSAARFMVDLVKALETFPEDTVAL